MNDFPSLYELALNVVVDSFTTRLLPTDHVILSPNVRENIFEGAMRARNCYDDHTETLIKLFQPTKLQLDFNYITNGTFREVRKLKLTELKMEKFEYISRYSVRASDRDLRGAPSNYYFCISSFLSDTLSRQTKQSLRILDLSGEKSFDRNWMRGVSLMFPNLEVLNICDRQMSESDFRRLCNNLPNLRFLNVNDTGIRNLKGISKLKNLEYLHIGSLEFETKEDIEDIFELKNLKHLIIGDNFNYATDYNWFFEKPHPELRTLTCDWEYADNDFLRRILPKLPKLKTVVAIFTEITQAAAPPGISLYTAETMECMMKSVEYLRRQGNWDGIMEILALFNQIWDPTEVGSICTPELMTSMVNELEAIIRHFKLVKQRLPITAEEFLEILPEFFNEGRDHLNVNKLKVIEMLMMELKNYLQRGTPPTDTIFKSLWDGIQSLVTTTENFNADKICSLAMESIIHGGRIYDSEQSCLVLLEMLIVRMDLSLEYYKDIDFQKLFECLRAV